MFVIASNLSIATASPAMPLEPLRCLLQAATRDVHERLHRHPGLGAVQAGSIDRPHYVALLGRLYGFHGAFENVTQSTPQRSGWLEGDLTALGVEAGILARLPSCTGLAAIDSPARRLGAHYVVEGSALGGRGLARQLDALLGPGVLDGRRFFSGNAGDTGRVWRACLGRIADVSAQSEARAAVMDGAILTFSIFEQWLAGWDDDNG